MLIWSQELFRDSGGRQHDQGHVKHTNIYNSSKKKEALWFERRGGVKDSSVVALRYRVMLAARH